MRWLDRCCTSPRGGDRYLTSNGPPSCPVFRHRMAKEGLAVLTTGQFVCTITDMSQDYSISSEVTENDEGSDFVTVTITFADGETITEHFASYFDSPCESAVVQASSYIAAFEESQMYTLEERLGPYGLEWEREIEERMEYGAPLPF